MPDTSFDQQPLPADMVTTLFAIEDWNQARDRVAEWLQTFPQYRDDLLLIFSALSDQLFSLEVPEDPQLNAAADRGFERAFRAIGLQGHTAAVPPVTFAQLMHAASATKTQLSKQIGLGIDVIDKLQQGKINIATIPAKLLERCSTLLHQPYEQVRNALIASTLTKNASPALRKGDASIPSQTQDDHQESFTDAVQQSPNMTSAAKAVWIAS